MSSERVATFESAGSEVWFRCAKRVNPYDLEMRLNEIDGKERRIPKQRSQMESLQCAMSELCKLLNKSYSRPGQNYLVRCLSGQHGRELFLEDKGVDHNQLRSVVVVKVVNEGKDLAFYRADGTDADTDDLQAHLQQMLCAEYDSYRETIGPKIVNALIECKIQEMYGLKITGKRSWFIDKKYLETWNQLSNAVRDASVDLSLFFHQEYKLEGEALVAVQISIEEEVDHQVEQIMLDVKSIDFTDRMLDHRVALMERMRDKIERYEELFNAGLDHCRAKVKELVDVIEVCSAADNSDQTIEQQELFSLDV